MSAFATRYLMVRLGVAGLRVGRTMNFFVSAIDYGRLPHGVKGKLGQAQVVLEGEYMSLAIQKNRA